MSTLKKGKNKSKILKIFTGKKDPQASGEGMEVDTSSMLPASEQASPATELSRAVAVYTLWCLFEGDQVLFQVAVSSNQNIFQLKKLVFNECSPTPGLLNAKDLILMKVRHIMIFMLIPE